MGEVLHAGALLPAAVGACCVLGSRRSGRVVAGVSALVMLAAMLDASTRMLGLAPFVWAGILVLLALVGSALARANRPGPAAPPHTSGMAVHGGAGLVVTALLLMAMTSTAPVAGAATSAHHGAGTAAIAPLAAAAAALYLLASLLFAARLAQPARGTESAAAAHPHPHPCPTGAARLRAALPALEVVSMGVSAGLMAIAVLA